MRRGLVFLGLALSRSRPPRQCRLRRRVAVGCRRALTRRALPRISAPTRTTQQGRKALFPDRA